jgi:NitT/TauT family transport system permease protein
MRNVLSLLARKGSGIAVLIVLWEIVARVTASPLMPATGPIAGALVEMVADGIVARNMSVSLVTIAGGFGLATVLGVTLGVIMAQWDLMHAVVSPVVDLLRPVTALTFFPLLILFLGLGVESKMVVIFWQAWPSVVLATVLGMRAVDQYAVEAATLDGADRFALLRHITFPLAQPTIVTGLRIALGAAWMALLAAEMLGSNAGLGYAVLAYSQSFEFAKLYAAIVVVALSGLVLNQLMHVVQQFAERNVQ